MSTPAFHSTPRPQQVTSYSALKGAIDLSRVSSGYPGKENRHPSAGQRRSPTDSLNSSLIHPATWGHGVQISFEAAVPPYRGWRFADIRAGRRRNLHLADSPAILDPRIPGLELRIVWPGYAHMREISRISLVRAGSPVSRFDLASEVVDAFEVFLEKARRVAFDSRESSVWKITSSTSVNDLVLLALTSTDANPCVFQAVVDVVPRH